MVPLEYFLIGFHKKMVLNALIMFLESVYNCKAYYISECKTSKLIQLSSTNHLHKTVNLNRGHFYKSRII